MQTYDAILLHARRGSAIRWPFRLLALLLVLAALTGTLGSCYIALTHQDPRAALLALAGAPLAALIVRLGGCAVWKGTVAGDACWPFASRKVAMAWLLLTWVVVYCV